MVVIKMWKRRIALSPWRAYLITRACTYACAQWLNCVWLLLQDLLDPGMSTVSSISCISYTGRQILYSEPPGKPIKETVNNCDKCIFRRKYNVWLTFSKVRCRNVRMGEGTPGKEIPEPKSVTSGIAQGKKMSLAHAKGHNWKENESVNKRV